LTRRELCSGQRRRTRCHWPRDDSQPVGPSLGWPQRIHGHRWVRDRHPTRF